jgi:sec-independent protein translocase protein TatC
VSLLPRRLRHGERAELVAHLDELRRRLFLSAAALVVAFGVSYALHERIIGWLNAPLQGRKPITLGVAEPFTTSLTVSLYAAVALALPVLLWQSWAYLAPAVDERRQQSIARLVLAASLLLGGGMAFAYWVVLPSTIPFLLGFNDDLFQIEVRARDYYSFAALTILGIGLLFELPVFLLGLVRLGILTSARLRRNRRIGIATLVVTSVALPGVDPATTILQTIPLLVLFEASIWAAVYFERRWSRSPIRPEPLAVADGS